MGLWEEESEEVMQLVIGSFQFTFLNFVYKLISPY
ncbi:hypothetical protein QF042_002064 [Pedobacter sp. W3I1]|nr:hypothetical protein [Pedobacter sp. W3I1]